VGLNIKSKREIHVRIRCAPRSITLAPAAKRRPKAPLPPMPMLVLLSNPRHLFPIIHAHASRTRGVHEVRPVGRGAHRSRTFSRIRPRFALLLTAIYE